MGPPDAPAGADLGLSTLTLALAACAPLLVVELVVLDDPGAGLVLVATALFATLALAIAAVVAVSQALVRGLSLRGPSAAAVLSLGVLIVTALVSARLFDGALASTLPGAAWGHIWVPLAAYAATATTLWLATPRVAASHARRRAVSLAFVVLALLVEVANRSLKVSEYPDIHTGLLVFSCAALAIGFGLAAPAWVHTLAARPQAHWLRRIVSGAVVVAMIISLRFGLRDERSRWTIATSGMHTRLLVRLARGAVDRDGDGFSSVLGGPDCDDHAPGIHPRAHEIPGNDTDEDCDGVALERADVDEVDAPDRRERLARWRSSAGVAQLLERTQNMNILMIAVDALRADTLARNPQNEAAFPAMFALIERSRFFSRTFSPSAGTDLSMSSVMTGRIDPFSGVETTLAEALDASGREGYAVIPTEVLRYVGPALLTRGLDGFRRLINDKFERDVGNYTTSQRTTDLGLAFLQRWGERTPRDPFFLWLHYFDVHEHDEVKTRDRRLREVIGGERPEGKAAKYRALVRVVDAELARLDAELRDRGLADETIVVFLSDHGESLGEDPRLPDNHGKYVYNALVHVPMAIRIPGVAGAVVDAPTSLIDVFPTVVELAGASLPDNVDGESLLPHLVDGAPAELSERTRPIALNESDQLGVIRWPHKLLVRSQDNLRELYDIEQDYRELVNLAPENPQLAAELHALYDSLPSVTLDRTRRGRWLRERKARATGNQ